MASMELQAPENFTTRTVTDDDRTRKFVASNIAKGFEIIRSKPATPIDIDVVAVLRETNTDRPVVDWDIDVAIALFEDEGGLSLEVLHGHFGIRYLEFAGTVLLNSVGMRYHACLSRLEGGTWYWYARHLARDPAPKKVRGRAHVKVH